MWEGQSRQREEHCKGTEAGKTWGGVPAGGCYLLPVRLGVLGGGARKTRSLRRCFLCKSHQRVVSWGVARSDLSSVKKWAGSAHLPGPPFSCILECSICDWWRR